MQATIKGQFLTITPTRSGKGHMLAVLQDSASCELYVPGEGVEVPKLERLDHVVIEASIRPGYEGKGFQATVREIAKAGSVSAVKAS